MMSYSDAARVLGGTSNRTVKALDGLTGGLLLGAAAGGAAWALSLFDAKSEVARLSSELVAGLNQTVAGLGRFDRSERLAAAHSVIVVTAYFEAIAGAQLPFEFRKLGVNKADQVGLAGVAPLNARLSAVADALLQAQVPMPAPHTPYEQTIERISELYRQMSNELLNLCHGLAIWDQLNETERSTLATTLSSDVRENALSRYEELFRRLATDFPEVAFWTNSVDHQATRAEIAKLRGG